MSQTSTATSARRGRGRGRGRGGPPRPAQRPNGVQRTARSASPSTRTIPTGPADVWERYQALKKHREKERAEAIANGFLADPDRPRTLAEAITPVGTCQDMCPEYERVERIVQKDVWEAELDPDSLAEGASKRVPAESRMVKKFRRAAAGIDEQLPSDLRPPTVLQWTVNYLFNDLVSEADSIASVHHFIWDRTRAIRNDFSIQQVTKLNDIRIAIESYERIARFHILTLHQLAQPQKPHEKYDWYQDREQLDRTLLSLMQYYDDSRNHFRSPNEAEFRAYCIIFQIQDPTPDLEDRIQSWPTEIVQDSRVQTALKLYAAAGNVADAQGPLKPRTQHPIAQANWQRFWKLVKSNAVSYLMACVAEIYFNLVRRIALNSLLVGYRQGGNTRNEDWSIKEMVDVLGFDNEEQVRNFVGHYGFGVGRRQDDTQFLDFSTVQVRQLGEPSAGLQPQLFSRRLVEFKRCGRTLSAVINGLTVSAARKAGLIEESEEMEDALEENGESDSLFVRQDEGEKQEPPKPITNGIFGLFSGSPAVNGAAAGGFFGKPSMPLQPPAAEDTSPEVDEEQVQQQAEDMRKQAEEKAARERLERQQEERRQEQLRQEAARLEAQKQEAARREAERREAERLEAQRREAQRQEAQRQEAMRLEAQRQEALRREEQRRQQLREEAQRQAALAQEARQRKEAGLLDGVAEDLFLNPIGILKQFVEYTAGPIIEASLLEFEADEFRRKTLYYRYGLDWRDIATRLRLRRQGREKRRRMQVRRAAAAAANEKTNPPPFEPGSSVFTPAVQDELDRLNPFRHRSVGTTQHLDTSRSAFEEHYSGPPKPEPPQPAGSAPAQTILSKGINPSANHHRRTPSTRRRPSTTSTRPTSTTTATPTASTTQLANPSASTSKTSPTTVPFLSGQSVLGANPDPHHPARLSTTRTNYFRLKAMGIDPSEPWKSPAGNSSLHTKPLPRNSPPTRILPRDSPPMAPPAPPLLPLLRERERKRGRDEMDEGDAAGADEALFARVRRVQRGLDESMTWYREDREREALRRSAGSAGSGK
ncbi:hypothetical protein W97_05260 [Coniosporium apollinis CBS 100218]|uniref:SAC3/GANP/THP3 conserved domain-containing protein n=1 Tax=Coniosporium apollinis (strain CBS 100218) TaxID=1168221 RepID=R7YVU6_CONA1|nr:uncharacterized protein W97_05260 [Coniosporium apollinis CBS 100218]EON66017.1 hypothetical protein W97_05260 [Coniosporium apollinis CBS 100218]